MGKDEKCLNVTLGKINLQEAKVSELLIGQFCSRIYTDETYLNPCIEFRSLLEAADHSRINELECSLIASA